MSAGRAMDLTMIRLIAAREIKARWALCPGALVFGILAMMVTRTLDVEDGGPADMLMITRVVGCLAAGMIGLSLLGDQLTDGRLSFYFTRPFTPRAIFTGKLVGGIALALAIHLCLVVPVVLGFPDLPDPSAVIAAHATHVRPSLDVTMPELMVGVVACVFLGMAAGIAVRSRTRWVVLDVLGVAALLVTVGFILVHVNTSVLRIEDWATTEGQRAAPRLLTAYFSKVSLLLAISLITALAALAYATARALARGRIDREVAHAALSKTLWPLLAPIGSAAVAAVVLWL